uniref:Uncharacterized protein n=1 Tax=Podarcis muralis TaxID=64176 RepID=A0A670IPP5_PODMU
SACGGSAETWEKMPLLKRLYCARCVAVGDKLYVTGGVHTDNSYSDTMHEYSPLRGRWTQLPSMSVARASHGFLACNQQLFAMGGRCKYEGYLDTAECFDLERKFWAPIKRMPFVLSHFASAVLRNKLYLVGGVTKTIGSWCASQKVLIYEVSSDTWSQVYLDNECYWSGAVAMNNGIYVIGGYFRRNLRCTRKCFFLGEDGQLDRRVTIPRLPIELAGAGVVRWKHRIYVLGGENAYMYNNLEGENKVEYYNTVYYWELGAPKWVQCQERLPFTSRGLSGFGCTTMKIPQKPILELFRKTSVALTAIECFLVNETGKISGDIGMPKLPRGVANAGVVSCGKRIYVLGGEDLTQCYKMIYYWEPGEPRWHRCTTEIPTTREGISSFGCVTMMRPIPHIRQLFQVTALVIVSAANK